MGGGTMKARIGLLAAASLWMLVSGAVQAQIPALRDVPDDLPAAARGPLVAAHELLAARRDELKNKVVAHNLQCSSVLEGSPAATACAEAQAELQQAVEAYAADVERFNEAVDRAEQETQNKSVALPDTQTPSQHVRMGAAADVRGTVYWLTGDGRQLPVTAGSPVYTGEHVITGANSRLQLLLLDETAFTMGPNSDMVLDEFVYDSNTNSEKIAASVSKGIFRWVTGKAARKDPANMKVKLPVGIIGIRGTDFEVEYEPGAQGYIRLFSGELEIAEAATGRTFIMNAGQMVNIGGDGAFSPPGALTAR